MIYDNFKRKLFMSVSEKKYNSDLKKFEKKLIQRLYTEPMNLKKSVKKINYEINLEDSGNDIPGNYGIKKSYSDFAKVRKKFMTINNENQKGTNDENKKNNDVIKEYKSKNCGDYEKEFKQGFNTVCNFHNKFANKRKNLAIKTNEDENIKFNHVDDKTFNKYFDYNKTCYGIKNPKREFKFTDPKTTNDHKMKVAFNFKQKPKKKFNINNIKIEQI